MGKGGTILRRLGLGASRLAGQSRGGIAVSFALLLPFVLGTLGLASDYAMMFKIRTDLQKAADAAAVAGAREIPLARANAEQVKSAAQSFAAYALTGNGEANATKLSEANLSVEASVIDKFTAVRVDVSEDWTPFFAHFIQAGVTPVNVTATARYAGSDNICVLGLATANRGVVLDKNSHLTGNNCGVFSDSTDADSLSINDGAFVKASIVCAVGGAAVSSSATVDPTALTDCPVIADPLAGRPSPGVGGCDHTAFTAIDQNLTLSPGVYCGGIAIGGTSNATLGSGIYVLSNGPLQISGSSHFTGEGVSFFITGAAPGKINFTNNTHVLLSAPESGAMAGLLFYEDRALAVKLKHRISSNDARKLIGTIYLPVGDLVVDATNPVADQSAYTAIIAQHIELNKGPNLILNSDYELTNVPVPEGLKGTTQVVLIQ